MSIEFPEDFMPAQVPLDDVPLLKAWGARFFVEQPRALWRVRVPAGLPERLAFVSLIDAIIGEIISACDALERSLGDVVRANSLQSWEQEIRQHIISAKENDDWLARILVLRNEGLHGSYLPEQIRIGGRYPVDMRLQRYTNGIVSDTDLPEDFSFVCDRMEELISLSRLAVATAIQQRNSRNDAQTTQADSRRLANEGVCKARVNSVQSSLRPPSKDLRVPLPKPPQVCDHTLDAIQQRGG